MIRVIYIICFVASLFVRHSLNGQGTAPKYSNEFLTLGAGSRAIALGNSSVSYVDDASAGYWNPAGILKATGNQLILMHASYFAGIANYDYAAYMIKLDSLSGLNFSLIRFAFHG